LVTTAENLGFLIEIDFPAFQSSVTGVEGDIVRYPYCLADTANVFNGPDVLLKAVCQGFRRFISLGVS